MSEKGTASLRGGTGLLPAGIIIAVLVAVAAFLTLKDDGQLDEEAVTSVATSDVPVTVEKTESEPQEVVDAPRPTTEGDDEIAADSAPTEEAEIEIEAPSIDEVRVDESGTIVVAGRGAPGSQIDILLDGEVVTSAMADKTGAFAAIASIPDDNEARSLTLRSGEGADAVASSEEIILAPVISAPAVVADNGVSEEVEDVTATETLVVAEGSAPKTGQTAGEPAEIAAKEDSVPADQAPSDDPVVAETPSPTENNVFTSEPEVTANAESESRVTAEPESTVTAEAESTITAELESTMTAEAESTVTTEPESTLTAGAKTSPAVPEATPAAEESSIATKAPEQETVGASAALGESTVTDQEPATAESKEPAPQEVPAQETERDTNPSQQVAVLRSDEQGVTLLQPAAPPIQRVVLDTIGYNDEGIVQLGGRSGQNTTEVLAYLNNKAVAKIAVDAGGNWRGEVPGIDPGVYTLRIDALAKNGRVVSRIETPFKREAPEVLAAAQEEAESTGLVRAVTVQAGDTLWAIARERYGEGLLYVQVFEANSSAIKDPDLIYPGQVFELPVD